MARRVGVGVRRAAGDLDAVVDLLLLRSLVGTVRVIVLVVVMMVMIVPLSASLSDSSLRRDRYVSVGLIISGMSGLLLDTPLTPERDHQVKVQFGWQRGRAPQHADLRGRRGRGPCGSR